MSLQKQGPEDVLKDLIIGYCKNFINRGIAFNFFNLTVLSKFLIKLAPLGFNNRLLHFFSGNGKVSIF